MTVCEREDKDKVVSTAVDMRRGAALSGSNRRKIEEDGKEGQG